MCRQQGNISLIIITSTLILIFLFALLFDLCHIFVAREQTKNASDSIVLAVSQNLLYFEKDYCLKVAEQIADGYGCRLASLEMEYDYVQATAEKKVRLMLAGLIIDDAGTVRSASRSQVMYPWEARFNYCDYYKFDYRED